MTHLSTSIKCGNCVTNCDKRASDPRPPGKCESIRVIARALDVSVSPTVHNVLAEAAAAELVGETEHSDFVA
jgi:hypothetical protein